jgi:hypothetical protein
MHIPEIHLVEQYIDGELESAKESYLFSTLSMNNELRNYFKQLSKIKTAINYTSDPFPEALERRILYSIKDKKVEVHYTLTKKIFYTASVLILFIMMFLTSFLFMEVNSYKKEIELMNNKLVLQNQTIKILYNSLPQVDIKADFENEITIKANL